MTHPLAQQAADHLVAETPIDKTRRLMVSRRRRDDAADRGNWHGIAELAASIGGAKEAVRGDLISLVASGEVEISQCINGLYWRAFVEPVKPAEPRPSDGTFILQREIADARGGQWFDAETFQYRDQAERALRFARAAEQARIDGLGGTGYTGKRCQRMRLLKIEVL